MFVGLFDSKIDIIVWCKNTFDNSDDFLLKFTSVFNARSSIIKHQLLTPVLQPSNISFQPSGSNLPQFKNKSKVRFHSTLPRYLSKLLFKTVKQSPFSGNLKFEGMPQIGKSVNLFHNMRFLTIFAGEGG